MNPPSSLVERLVPLVIAQLEGDISPEEMSEIESLICQDEEARRLYVRLIRESVGLRFWGGAAVSPVGRAETNRAHAELSTLPLAPSSPPVLGFLGNTIHGTVSYFSSDWPVAYLVATVIFGIGLLIGSIVPVSQPVQVARQSVPLPSPLSPLLTMVGRITGMVDCRFDQRSEISDSKTQGPRPKTLVSLGDTFALSSGLLEITYDTGAKVILQGPVTYEIESRTGGFLSLGKLTARVESGEWRVESKSPNLQVSKSPNPSLSTLHSPLFTIKTPTALVTDLGTEFGVEVDRHGGTMSHVYRGSVTLQVTSNAGRMEGNAQVLHANESAHVENRGDRGGSNRVIVLGPSAKPADFVREIPRQIIKTLDLVDVVAGGDGFSGRRNRGIDPRNGRASDTLGGENPMFGDEKYHRAEAMAFVDGVFIPHGGAGPVRLDSAGHVFDEFPATDNKTSDFIWAGGQFGRNSAELDGIDYASPGHGQIALCANKGITFDLAAIRRANPDWKLVRFRAVTGNTEQESEKGAPVYADVWVFVDGQVQFRRREINRYNGAMPITIPIHDTDRFLTLVATDGGNGYQQDLIIFGDPRLELLPAKTTTDSTPPREAAEH